MKNCKQCGFTKEDSDFHVRRKSPDGLNPYCKVCIKENNREHYEKYSERCRNRTKERHAERRLMIGDHFALHPCIDCGENDPVVLEFDHVNGVKVDAISELVRKCASLEKISEEMKKCVVRCANCHRRKTAVDENWWQLQLRSSRD